MDLSQRLGLFPDTTRVVDSLAGSRLTIAGCDLAHLASEYGTPLYLYDRQTMDATVTSYQEALVAYPGQSGLTYAGKAYLCTAIAQWAAQEGLWLDCTGEGELAIAAAANVPRPQILVHGVSKTKADLQAALSQAGTLVVDNLDELNRLASLLAGKTGKMPNLWLRLRPGVAVNTHAYTQTGQSESKFGFSEAEWLSAAQLCLARGLPLAGLHFHQGSHFHDPQPLNAAITAALDLVSRLRQELGWTPAVFCPGGGWGVAYHESELPHPNIAEYVLYITGCLAAGCQQRDLPLPRLQLEPGRSLVARAGVALYQVQAVKQTAGRRWLLLDGGLADNPRRALYQARYSALPVSDPLRPPAGTAWLGGPYCESGDILIEDLPMPELLPGELIAVPVSGAYQLSMASNYNGARKPAVLWLDNGQARLIQRRETLPDLLRRDSLLDF